VDEVEAPHASDCAHCQAQQQTTSAETFLSTKAELDYIFKDLAKLKSHIIPKQTFDFFKGSQIGDSASVQIADHTYSGRITVVRENHELARSYGVALEDGLGALMVSTDGGGCLRGHILFKDDSRAITFQEVEAKGSHAPSLIVYENQISDIFCAQPDSVYTGAGVRSPTTSAAGNRLASKSQPVPAMGSFTVAAMDSNLGSEYVLYLDFDGETVSNTLWNILDFEELEDQDLDAVDLSSYDSIVVLPQSRSDDDVWIEQVWRRVVEDFAPFNINVTTDRAVFDAADVDKRVQALITSSTTVTGGAGGVAFLHSFREDSPIVWVVNSDEAVCASTISHEAGHAFGLNHDSTPALDYYFGHTGSYAPGWAPIMGAFFGDGIYDEVDQWSIGEYDNADNFEDDLSIIADTIDPQEGVDVVAWSDEMGENNLGDKYYDFLYPNGVGISNGFGYKADDIDDTTTGANLGTFTTPEGNTVRGYGQIGSTDDVDVFEFVATEGVLRIAVSPLDINSIYSEAGSETSGANLAVNTELVSVNNAGDETTIAIGLSYGDNLLSSLINEDYIAGGTYYLKVTGGGRGVDPSTGFSDYGSLGGYSIFAEFALPPLSVAGGDKQDVAILNGDTHYEVSNGTEFGYTVPNDEVINTFLIKNVGTTMDVENVSLSLLSGADFEIDLPEPSGAISPEGFKELNLIYRSSTTGVHTDTVRIEYEAAGTHFFEFAIRGVTTSSSTRDNYENNNSGPAAFNLTNAENVWLSDYKGMAFFGDDSFKGYFTFTTQPGDGVVTVDTLYGADTQNVTFELFYLNNGQPQLLLTSTSSSGTLQYLIPESSRESPVEFNVVVTSTDNSTVRNEYDLRWSAQPLIVGGDDLYEKNNTIDEAFDMTGGAGPSLVEQLGLGVSSDDDWYELIVPWSPFTRMLYVAAEFDHEQGNIDIQVFKGTQLLDFSATDEDMEVVTIQDIINFGDYEGVNGFEFAPIENDLVMGLEAGTYYVRVYGDFAGNSYDLTVESVSDDRYEVTSSAGTENDTQAAAFSLGESIVGKWLSDVDGLGASASYPDDSTEIDFSNDVDDDWYSFTIPAEETVKTLTLEYVSYTGGATTGLIQFSFVNSAGTVLATTSDSTQDPGLFTIYNPTGSQFWIQTSSGDVRSALSNYDFRVNYTTVPSFTGDQVEDDYEQNDTFLELFDIIENEGRWLSGIDGYGIQWDADWFEISIPSNVSKLTARLYHVTADGDMDLTLSKKEGPVHFVASGGGDNEIITWNDPIPGEYALTVTGDRFGNFYNLLWDLTYSEDNYEENDDQATAFNIISNERRYLSKLDGTGIQADADWYRITARADTVELRASATFSHAEGDIDLALYNASGSMIRRAISSTNNESLTYPNPAAGDYFIRVYYDNAGNEYDLTWAALSQAELDAVPTGDDAYEVSADGDENDTIDFPYTLTATQPRLSTLLGLGIQSDADWYEIVVPADNTGLRIECLFSDADGDIDFELYDPIGFPIVIRDSITDNEILELDTRVPAGTYQIRVYGSGLGNEYDLYWNAYVEDIYEENDSRSAPYDLSQEINSPLISPTQGDEDWYVFEVNRITPFIEVSLDYLDANGAVDFQILNASGAVLATADSGADSEYVHLEVVNGTYYVRVYGDNAYNQYDMTISVLGDDIYEENDVVADAKDIAANVPLSLVQFDDDWFTFEVTNPNVFLSIIPTVDVNLGDIHVRLFEDSDLDNPIGESPLTGNKGFRVSGSAGTYYIQVTGDNTNPNYQLLWTVAPDDQYEENDELAEATDLTLGEGLSIDAVQFDEDWFEIAVQPGNVRLVIELDYLQVEGNLNVTLYNAAGVELAIEDTDPDNEVLAYSVYPFGASAETYYIKVSGANVGTEYSLTWEASPEDNFEGETGNNVYGDPSDVLLDTEGQPISTTIGYGGAVNEDWYEVRINSGDDGIVIEVFFIHTDENNIDLELFGENEIFLTRSIGVSNVERIHYKGAADTTYYLRVFGTNGGNAYDLVWNSYKEDDLEKAAEGDFEVKDDTPDNDAPGAPRGLLDTEYNSTFYPASGGGDDPDLEYFLLDNLTQLDEDWYVVEVEPGEDIFILELKFEHIYGDIDVAIYDRASGTLIQQTETETDDERIEISDLDPGEYLICVYGYGIVNPKSDPTWNAGDFNPFTDDLVDWPGYDSIQEDEAGDYYDLAEANARGLGSTYSLQWVSATEDVYDEEDPDLGVNDSQDKSAAPVLVDQEGVIDPAVRDPDPQRTYPEENSSGQIVQVSYRPVYSFDDLAQFDEDWYEIPIDTGGDYEFFATIYFNALHGNLDLYLYAENGVLIDSSISTEGYAESVEASGDGFTKYYLKVVGNDLGVPYDLEIRGFFDDDYEDNETIAEATVNADLSEMRGIRVPSLVSRDVDIYRIEVPADQVHLYFYVYGGGVAFETAVLDSTGNVLPGGFERSGRSTETNDNRSSGVIAPDAGTYYLQVSATSGLSYELRWYYNNIDQYEADGPYWSSSFNNDSPADATELTRIRLEPPYNPDNPGPLAPIKEFAFDYALLSSLTLDTPGSDPFGHATQEDDDWYSIQIPSWSLESAKKGDKSVEVLKRDYYVRLSTEIEFTHTDGDINLEIYEDLDPDDDQSPLTLLARSETANDIESLFARIDPLDEDRLYLIRVYGDPVNGNKSNDYSLKWDVSKQDAYEELEDNYKDDAGVEFNTENDTNNFVDLSYELAEADEVSTEDTWLHEITYLQDVNGDDIINGLDAGFSSATGYGMQITDDWYAVVVSEGTTQIEVDLKFYSDNDMNYEYGPDDLDMDFEVYYLAGNDGDDSTADLRKPVLIGRSTSDTDTSLFVGTGAEAQGLNADITTEIQESATFELPLEELDGTEPPDYEAKSLSGIYFIRIYYDNRSHPYTFKWDDIGGTEDPSGDEAIIEDYRTGNWSLVVPAKLPSAQITEPAANRDGDAFPNWAEFALGLDNTVADFVVIGQSIAEIDGQQYYQIEFQRNIHAVGLGYEFIVQESEGLNFGAKRAEYVRRQPIDGTDLERVFYRCSNPMNVQSRCFFRLKMVEPEAKD
jgi:hypothetical protein